VLGKEWVALHKTRPEDVLIRGPGHVGVYLCQLGDTNSFARVHTNLNHSIAMDECGLYFNADDEFSKTTILVRQKLQIDGALYTLGIEGFLFKLQNANGRLKVEGEATWGSPGPWNSKISILAVQETSSKVVITASSPSCFHYPVRIRTIRRRWKRHRF
jgi:hypothetical protein